jgi:hypothetical protein
LICCPDYLQALCEMSPALKGKAVALMLIRGSPIPCLQGVKPHG